MHNWNQLPETISDRLDERIAAGLRQGKQHRLRVRKRWSRGLWSCTAIVLLFGALLYSARLSPAIAAAMREIPGLKTFVALLEQTSDRGVRLAVEHEYYQPVGVSDERDGLVFTVEGVIADETRAVLFYSLSGDREAGLIRATFADGQANPLPAVISWGHPAELEQYQSKTGPYRGTIDLQLSSESEMPEELLVHVTVQPAGANPAPSGSIGAMPTERAGGSAAGSQAGSAGGAGADAAGSQARAEDRGGVDGGFRVRVPIDRSSFATMKEHYPLNASLDVEGQKVTFVSAVVSPLRIAVELAFDPDNRMQLFGAADIRLVDEEGTVWRSLSSTPLSPDRQIVYFESSYFRQPKELYIEGELFRGVDKLNRSIVIDTERGELLQAPDSKVGLVSIEPARGASIKLTLSLDQIDPNDNMGFSLLDKEFTDGSGQPHQLADTSGTVVQWNSGTNTQTSFYHIPKAEYKQPLSFEVQQYPGYVREPYRIRIR